MGGFVEGLVIIILDGIIYFGLLYGVCYFNL